ncbi:hypothetical protein TGARI_306400 [Toxoplasma gondii ARI]|uniref:C3H1-type domain-containing protein n=1 Tax=Toxoplasma gondii ARI TaxID=1074872 RepID=A0A139Y0U2_TOXGO|nr:hypothetical protein TGARI_306400 [Toxoplasma gondii ARI]
MKKKKTGSGRAAASTRALLSAGGKQGSRAVVALTAETQRVLLRERTGSSSRRIVVSPGTKTALLAVAPAEQTAETVEARKARLLGMSLDALIRDEAREKQTPLLPVPPRHNTPGPLRLAQARSVSLRPAEKAQGSSGATDAKGGGAAGRLFRQAIGRGGESAGEREGDAGSGRGGGDNAGRLRVAGVSATRDAGPRGVERAPPPGASGESSRRTSIEEGLVSDEDGLERPRHTPRCSRKLTAPKETPLLNGGWTSGRVCLSPAVGTQRVKLVGRDEIDEEAGQGPTQDEGPRKVVLTDGAREVMQSCRSGRVRLQGEEEEEGEEEEGEEGEEGEGQRVPEGIEGKSQRAVERETGAKTEKEVRHSREAETRAARACLQTAAKAAALSSASPAFPRSANARQATAERHPAGLGPDAQRPGSTSRTVACRETETGLKQGLKEGLKQGLKQGLKEGPKQGPKRSPTQVPKGPEQTRSGSASPRGPRGVEGPQPEGDSGERRGDTSAAVARGGESAHAVAAEMRRDERTPGPAGRVTLPAEGEGPRRVVRRESGAKTRGDTPGCAPRAAEQDAVGPALQASRGEGIRRGRSLSEEGSRGRPAAGKTRRRSPSVSEEASRRAREGAQIRRDQPGDYRRQERSSRARSRSVEAAQTGRESRERSRLSPRAPRGQDGFRAEGPLRGKGSPRGSQLAAAGSEELTLGREKERASGKRTAKGSAASPERRGREVDRGRTQGGREDSRAGRGDRAGSPSARIVILAETGSTAEDVTNREGAHPTRKRGRSPSGPLEEPNGAERPRPAAAGRTRGRSPRASQSLSRDPSLEPKRTRRDADSPPRREQDRRLSVSVSRERRRARESARSPRRERETRGYGALEREMSPRRTWRSPSRGRSFSGASTGPQKRRAFSPRREVSRSPRGPRRYADSPGHRRERSPIMRPLKRGAAPRGPRSVSVSPGPVRGRVARRRSPRGYRDSRTFDRSSSDSRRCSRSWSLSRSRDRRPVRRRSFSSSLSPGGRSPYSSRSVSPEPRRKAPSTGRRFRSRSPFEDFSRGPRGAPPETGVSSRGLHEPVGSRSRRGRQFEVRGPSSGGGAAPVVLRTRRQREESQEPLRASRRAPSPVPVVLAPPTGPAPQIAILRPRGVPEGPAERRGSLAGHRESEREETRHFEERRREERRHFEGQRFGDSFGRGPAPGPDDSPPRACGDYLLGRRCPAGGAATCPLLHPAQRDLFKFDQHSLCLKPAYMREAVALGWVPRAARPLDAGARRPVDPKGARTAEDRRGRRAAESARGDRAPAQAEERRRSAREDNASDERKEEREERREPIQRSASQQRALDGYFKSQTQEFLNAESYMEGWCKKELIEYFYDEYLSQNMSKEDALASATAYVERPEEYGLRRTTAE